MNLSVTYLTDNKGKKTAVQISMKDWNTFLIKYKKLEEYKKRKIELTKAFSEIRQFEQGKKKLKTAQQLLNEL